MKLSEFLRRIKLEIPNIGQPGLTDEYITNLLNQACDHVNSFCKVYKSETDFDISADKKTYSLAEIVPSYLGRDKRGLFFKDSAGSWKKILPTTEENVTENIQNFLNSSSVEIPTFYYITGDTIGFEPAPSTSTLKGAKLYHLKKSTPMSSADHFPFSGSTVEITALIPLDEPIIAWVKWKIAESYGTNTDVNLRQVDFSNALRIANVFVNRIPDVSMSSQNRMRL